MKISFLHTAQVHIATFDQLLENSLPKSTGELVHVVRADWLAIAQTQGLTRELRLEVSDCLRNMSTQADAVVCTCSSLSPIAQALQLPNLFSIDQPMMQLAVHSTPVLLVMCLASTEMPSTQSLEQAFKDIGADTDYRTLMCTQAWQHFEQGDSEQFGQAITKTITQELSLGGATGCIVLAQASMVAAEKYLTHLSIPVYSSPVLAAAKALEVAGSRNG